LTFFCCKAQEVLKEEANNSKEKESEEYRTINSFTELLTEASSDDLMKIERFF
jgi:hypothetical protein